MTSAGNILRYSTSINDTDQLASEVSLHISTDASGDQLPLNSNFYAVDNLLANAKRFRRETLRYRDQMRQFKRQPKLFDVILIITIKSEDVEINVGEAKMSPIVSLRIPEQLDKKLEDLLGPLPYFCYPDFTHAEKQNSFESEFFVITLTDPEGLRSFAYCCRYIRGTNVFPEVMTIVSPLHREDLYYSLLRCATQLIMEDYEKFVNFMTKVINTKIPKVAELPQTISSWMGSNCIATDFHHKKKFHFWTSLKHLGPDRLILIYSSLLAEKRIILVSDEIPLLTDVIQGVSALLNPMEWPHTLIPVVPQSHTDLCYCPSPYIMGLLRLSLPSLKELILGEEDVLIVDIKMGIVKQLSGFKTDANPIVLPKKFHDRLRQQLKSLWKQISNEVEGSLVEEINDKISSIFLQLHGKLLSHYRNCVVLGEGEENKLNTKEFLSSIASNSHRQFLTWLVETGLFQVWIEKRLKRLHEKDEWNKL